MGNVFCPVTVDEKAEPDIWVDYQGRRIYFCCRDCRKDFIDNPEAYLANLPDYSEENSSSSSLVHDHSEHSHKHHAQNADDPEQAKQNAEKMNLSENHDHAVGYGQASGFKRVIKFAGKFHPLVVHFPIALILCAMLAEILYTLTHQNPMFSSAGRFCIVIGAVGAVFATSLGWMAGEFARYPGALETVLFRHRWLGVGTAVFSTISAIVALIETFNPVPKYRRFYRFFLILTTILVSVTGHFGATLIYGLDYFKY